MSTYNRVKIGNDLLVQITMSKEGHTLEKVNWVCDFYTNGSHIVSIPKTKSHKIDENSYYCPLSTKDFEEGILYGSLKADLPNAYFDDGFKTEVVEFEVEQTYLYK